MIFTGVCQEHITIVLFSFHNFTLGNFNAVILKQSLVSRLFITICLLVRFPEVYFNFAYYFMNKKDASLILNVSCLPFDKEYYAVNILPYFVCVVRIFCFISIIYTYFFDLLTPKYE